MRLDKFLKVSRLIKRRTVAKDVTDQGRVWLNGKEVKPSHAVKIGDEVTIRYGQKSVVVRVERIFESSRKDEAEQMYSIIKEESHPLSSSI